MAVAIGGDLDEATYNHPTYGSGKLYFKAGEDGTVDPGGITGADDAQMIDGSGRVIRQLTRKRWSVEGVLAWDMNSEDELKQVNDMAGDPQEADWTFSHISGTVWGGKGSPVGDVQGSTNGATFTLKVSGGGTLKKIV